MIWGPAKSLWGPQLKRTEKQNIATGAVEYTYLLVFTSD